jgi:hypothetical protein
LLREAADYAWEKKVDFGQRKRGVDQGYENRLVSKISIWLQELETQEVWAAMCELRAVGVDPRAYCYDGFMLARTDREKVDAWISSKEGGDVKWLIKPWSKPLHPEGFREQFSAHNFDSKLTYEEKLAYFESYHAFISEPCLVLRETPGNDTSMALFTKNQAQTVMCNLQIPVLNRTGEPTGKTAAFIERWLRSPHRREYRTLDFDPDCVSGPGVFNLWRGFPIERVELRDDDKYDTAAIHRHMKLLMDDTEEGYQYLLNYLAQLVQFPGVKPLVAFLMVGPEGGGKSTFFSTLFEAFLGPLSVLQTADPEQIIGRFKQIGEKLAVLWEETSGRDSWSNANLVKTLVTELTQSIERKGKDAVRMRIPTRLFFFSNDEDGKPIRISPSDRRFVAVRTTLPADKHNYFDKLFGHVMACPFTLRRFFEELKQLNISHFNPARDRYIGPYYAELKEDCRDNMSLFWDQLCSAAHSPDNLLYLHGLCEGIDTSKVLHGEPVPCMTAYDWFREWAVRNHYIDKDKLPGPRAFGRTLAVRYIGYVTKRKERARGEHRNQQVFVFNDLPVVVE